jgi:hypothetical protein
MVISRDQKGKSKAMMDSRRIFRSPCDFLRGMAAKGAWFSPLQRMDFRGSGVQWLQTLQSGVTV